MHVHIGAQRRDDPTIEGTPAHLAAFVRGACAALEKGGVRLFKPMDGFTVPEDGAWMINGLYQLPGTVLDLRVGDTLAYLQARPDPTDDRPRKPVPLVPAKALIHLATSDKRTGAVHQPSPDARNVRLRLPKAPR